MQFATRAGFGGGLVVDYPNSRKAKKFYLCLWVGGEMASGSGGEQVKQELPRGLVAEHENPDAEQTPGSVKYEAKRRRDRDARKTKGKKSKDGVKGKDWILKKKELYRKRGKEVSIWNGLCIALNCVGEGGENASTWVVLFTLDREGFQCAVANSTVFERSPSANTFLADHHFDRVAAVLARCAPSSLILTLLDTHVTSLTQDVPLDSRYTGRKRKPAF